MRGRIGRREGSCGGGTSRADGFAVGLYINETVKAVLGPSKDAESMLCEDGEIASSRHYVRGHTFQTGHGSSICLV